MDDLSKMSLEDLAKRAVSSVPRRYYGHILAELRRRDEERKAMIDALHADNLPPPPVESWPPDPFVESYRIWYHGKRADALRSALSAFQEPVTR